jgi:hypothetical protein
VLGRLNGVQLQGKKVSALAPFVFILVLFLTVAVWQSY